MGREGDSHDDNLILFPGLVEKLVEKGMTSLKEKKFYDALKYFQQSVELEPTNEQARYGLVITNIELNRYDDAKAHCESMLKEGIGSYYEILQVYVSILIQLGNYQEVETILETVIQEEKLPPQLAESFYHLLYFSQQMTSSENKLDMMEEKKLDPITDKKEWLELLEKGKLEQQWGAVQKLTGEMSEDMIDACRSFLKKEENDPVLKSYILQMLKEQGVKDTVDVAKFGEIFQVNLGNLEDVFHERFGNEVVKRLDDELGQESPSLFQIVNQVWWHFLFALYPKAPSPLNIAVWAAALHIIGNMLMGDNDIEVEYICSRYGTKKEEVLKAVDELKKIESHLF